MIIKNKKGFKMNKKKDTTNINIRIDRSLKDRFIAVCKENESDSNKEIRKFIKEYLKKHSQTTMDF